MRFESIEAKVKLFFLKYVPVTYKVDQKPQQCITATRCGIAECLEVHDPAKRRIKKINDGQDKIPGAMNMTFH